MKQSHYRYHGPLIEFEIEYSYIKIFPWIGLFLSCIGLFASNFGDPLGVIKFIFLVCVFINLVSIIISLFIKKFSKFFIKFSYILLSLVFLTFIVDFGFIGLAMFLNNRNFGQGQSIYYSDMAIIYTILMFIIFIVFSGIYCYYYLPKNQGKKWKFNQWKTYKGKKEQLKTNYVIIFGLVMLSPVFLVGSIENIFGLLGGILFTATFPALIIDSLYAAYYVHKHPDYE